MFELIFRLLFGLLFEIICWLVLIPFVYLLATPVIFFMVLFKPKGNFWNKMREEYQNLWKFWKEWGLSIGP